MHLFCSLLLLLASEITPARTWYPPATPLNVTVKSTGDADLVMTDFVGSKVDAQGAAAFSGEASKDLAQVFPQITRDAGTYLLYIVPKGKALSQFEGTPLVVSARKDVRRNAPGGMMVTKVEPLRYAVMTTAAGNVTMGFYYDVAPNTVDSFLTLSSQGYYDGLLFHRIIPGFMIQGGDPRGDGTGGPGYELKAEFNDRPHEAGVLSMARSPDPDSAGSQFFVCLDYGHTQQLDHKYTTFGRVTDGMDAVKKMGATPTGEMDRPTTPQVIQKIEIKPVTAAENPYPALQKAIGGAGK